MNVVTLLQLIITLLQGVFTSLGKAGLNEAAAGVQAALTALENVHGSVVTQAQVESLKITPQW